MKKKSKSKNSIPKVDPYLEGFMAKLVERFVGLEKKMDFMISKIDGKPSIPGHPQKPIQIPQAPSQRRERPLYEAICADCHKVCEVPFRPSEDRPVYCKECFAKRKGRPSSGPGKNPVFLTPVALPPKPVGKLGLPQIPLAVPIQNPKKLKKKSSEKKAKKKKSK